MKTRKATKSRRTCPLTVESLENRVLLSSTAWLAGYDPRTATPLAYQRAVTQPVVVILGSTATDSGKPVRTDTAPPPSLAANAPTATGSPAKTPPAADNTGPTADPSGLQTSSAGQTATAGTQAPADPTAPADGSTPTPGPPPATAAGGPSAKAAPGADSSTSGSNGAGTADAGNSKTAGDSSGTAAASDDSAAAGTDWSQAGTTDSGTTADNSAAVNDVGNSDITAVDAGNIISINPINPGGPPQQQPAAGPGGKSSDVGEVLALIRLCAAQERAVAQGAEQPERLDGEAGDLEVQTPPRARGQGGVVAAGLPPPSAADGEIQLPVEAGTASSEILPASAELRTAESSPGGLGAVSDLVIDGLPVSLASLEQGVQRFLDQMDRMGGCLAGIQAEHGLSGWLLAGAAAVAACEMARRRARQRAPRFAVAADGSEAGGWKLDAPEPVE